MTRPETDDSRPVLDNYLQERFNEIDSLDHADARGLCEELLNELERGRIRAATRNEQGQWSALAWVKSGILQAFRRGVLVSYESGPLTFVDKNTIPPRRFNVEDGVRIVPGGSSVRRGAFVGHGVVVMPPAFVNIGAYVDEDTMIDSHALVGSCAQIGKRVHISAAAQIGGVLEPIGNVPVIVEDDVVVGGNAGIYEGTIVRSRAVIAAGVIITGSTPVFDLVRGEVYRRTPSGPLEIPSGAVIVPGSRPLRGGFAATHALHIYTPVIVKYRDEKTDGATALEEALR